MSAISPTPVSAAGLSTAAAAAAAAAAGSAAAAAPTALPNKLTVACIQMTSGDDMAANIEACSTLIRQAAAAGAKLICTPENTARMTALTQKTTAAPAAGATASQVPAASTAAPADATASQVPAASTAAPAGATASQLPAASTPPSAPSFKGHPVITALSALASELNVWILVGSIAVRVEEQEGPTGSTDAEAAPAKTIDRRFANRSVLLAPTERRVVAASPSPLSASAPSTSSSQTVAYYDKLHLFDVPSLNGSEGYLESARVKPGGDAVVVDCSSSSASSHDGLGQGVVLGLTVCYDLRFPQLFRALAQAGASILTVPSAFTVVTGRAHWHALLRARAIETGCFVLAPAQVGTHPGDRRTYGHSLIVGPWGDVLADAGCDSTGFVVAELDLDEVQRARSRVPSLLHDRPFAVVSVKQVQ